LAAAGIKSPPERSGLTPANLPPDGPFFQERPALCSGKIFVEITLYYYRKHEVLDVDLQDPARGPTVKYSRKDNVSVGLDQEGKPVNARLLAAQSVGDPFSRVANDIRNEKEPSQKDVVIMARLLVKMAEDKLGSCEMRFRDDELIFKIKIV